MPPGATAIRPLAIRRGDRRSRVDGRHIVGEPPGRPWASPGRSGARRSRGNRSRDRACAAGGPTAAARARNWSCRRGSLRDRVHGLDRAARPRRYATSARAPEPPVRDRMPRGWPLTPASRSCRPARRADRAPRARKRRDRRRRRSPIRACQGPPAARSASADEPSVNPGKQQNLDQSRSRYDMDRAGSVRTASDDARDARRGPCADLAMATH